MTARPVGGKATKPMYRNFDHRRDRSGGRRRVSVPGPANAHPAVTSPAAGGHPAAPADARGRATGTRASVDEAIAVLVEAAPPLPDEVSERLVAIFRAAAAVGRG